MITIYGTSKCKYCVKAVELMDSLDKSYTYYDIKDPVNKDKLDFIKNQGFKTIPQIYLNERHIGGYTELKTLTDKESYFMTNFEKVSQLNACIGNEVQYVIEDWQKLENQVMLIQSEFNELLDGLVNRDITEIRDAIADVLVTTYGLAYLMNVNADEDMDKVHTSNMSKFCIDMAEVDATRQKYADLGIETDVREADRVFAVVSAKEQLDHKGETMPKGKLLKSVNFFEPKL